MLIQRALLLGAICAPMLLAIPTGAAITATRVAEGLSEPVFATAAPGDNRLFILERAGMIRILDNGQLIATPFLDITTLVDDRDEGGLLGLAFPPGFAFGPGDRFYVYYSATASLPNKLQLRVARFGLLSGMETTRADAASEEVLFSIDKPFGNHNGGTIAFRGDWLYLGLGDGGGAGDPDDLAQDDTSFFGKLLRFDSTAATPWTPEQWAKGLRNPYRFSFDRQTGDLYIADVGDIAIEEVHVQGVNAAAGENFGWDVLEGDSCFDPDTPPEPPCNDPSLTLPVHQYDHVLGGACFEGFRGSITGGYVYRGNAIPEIDGNYFFADFCDDSIWTLVWDGAGGIVGSVTPREMELVPDQGAIESIVGFGEDDTGELYIVDFGGEVFRVPEPLGATPALAALAGLVAFARLRCRGSGARRSGLRN